MNGLRVTRVSEELDVWVITGKQGSGKSALAERLGLAEAEPGEAVRPLRVALTSNVHSHVPLAAAVKKRLADLVLLVPADIELEEVNGRGASD